MSTTTKSKAIGWLRMRKSAKGTMYYVLSMKLGNETKQFTLFVDSDNVKKVKSALQEATSKEEAFKISGQIVGSVYEPTVTGASAAKSTAPAFKPKAAAPAPTETVEDEF